MKDLNQFPDDIFRSGFSQHEAAFDPAAWDQMQTLLDKEDDLKPVLFIPENTGKKRKQLTLLIITIMSILTLLTLASSLLFNNHTVVDTKKSTNSTVNSSQTDKFNSDRATDKNTTSDNVTPSESIKKEHKDNKKIGSQKEKTNSSVPSSIKTNENIVGVETSTEAAKSAKTESEPNNMSAVVKDTFSTAIKNGKIYKVLTRTTWVPEEYDWVVDNSNKTISNGFIGMHFTAQKNRGGDSSHAGFNIQFMSGNRLQNDYWGLHGGIDWGMQFYGKSKKSNVALNNLRSDSGFARLRSHSMDFLGRGHLEYARYALIPYFNVVAGPRIYATNQQVSSYVPLKETESSASNNVHTSVSMLYGFGAGLRLRISPVVSLDARYEWINGSKVKQVDLGNSTFNGLSHELKYYTSKPRQEQFKFGILIDLSETQYEKKLIKEGYYKVTTIDSLQIDAKDSNKIYLPCNCGPCPDNDQKVSYPGSKESNDVIVYPRTREYQQEDNNTEPRTRNNSNSSGNKSGSKGEFPGIRPPAPKPVTPN